MNKKNITIIVGSKNPVKINAAKKAIAVVFSDAKICCQGMHAPSNVADQPMTEAETRAGAINRVKYCQQNNMTDFYIAIEGGVDLFEDGAAAFAYVAVADNKMQSIGRSANLPLPNVVYQSLQQGDELGDVMDRLFKTDNIKQKGGAMSLLTNAHVSRESVYTQALILTLAPFLNRTLYESY
jgi:inosine/xanthosine triphosphatase